MPEQTRGMRLVAFDFNPSGRNDVDAVKQDAADLIDNIERLCYPGRWRSLAVTAVEQAAMWAVKSLTNTDPVGDTLAARPRLPS